MGAPAQVGSSVSGAELTTDVFRAAMARFPTGVALLTHGPPETLEVMTVNSFISVSLEPLLVLISVRADSRMRARMDSGGPFAIHVLGAGQQHLAALFARRARPSGTAASARLAAVPSAAGNALVAGAEACFECVPYAQYPGGDHMLYLGLVLAVQVPFDASPALLFQHGAYAHTPISRATVPLRTTGVA
jgi:flavin reductase (DIM6/NTAB) family NADH-FMN oxidoreductase RutF